ncbi:MAG: thermonuclease family protein [Lentisphaerae bacterium]|nr:thermonuclease family protein [Lentisphaerota bacterium]
MNRLPAILRLGLFLLAALPLIAKADTLTGYVIAVTDGDTIRVLDAHKQQHRVRLFGIDAPESHQAFGNRARQYLANLAFQKNVTVTYTEKDQYGRILGTVFVGRQNLNLELVKAGMAWHYVYYAKNVTALADAEKEARQHRRGLWADNQPIPPWEFRRNRSKPEN